MWLSKLSRLFIKKEQTPEAQLAQESKLVETEAPHLRIRDLPETSDLSVIEAKWPPDPRFVHAYSVTQIVKQQGGVIRQLCTAIPLSDEVLEQHLLPTIWNLANFVHLLSASADNHHSGCGGLFAHSLETALYAVNISRNKIFDFSATPEVAYNNRARWILGTAFAALMHDVGKAVTDITVRTRDGRVWNPNEGPLGTWLEALGRPDYTFSWKPGRDYEAHPIASLDFARRIIPADAYAYLTKENREIEAEMREAIGGGSSKKLGRIAEIVRQADMFSVRIDTEKLKGIDNRDKRFASEPTLRIMRAMSELIATGQWTVNQPAGQVFSTNRGCFVAWPNTNDIVHLLFEQGYGGVPKNRDVMADMLASAQLIERPPEAVDTTKQLYWPVCALCNKDHFETCIKIAAPEHLFIGAVPSAVPAVIKQLEMTQEETEAWLNQWGCVPEEMKSKPSSDDEALQEGLIKEAEAMGVDFMNPESLPFEESVPAVNQEDWSGFDRIFDASAWQPPKDICFDDLNGPEAAKPSEEKGSPDGKTKSPRWEFPKIGQDGQTGQKGQMLADSDLASFEPPKVLTASAGDEAVEADAESAESTAAAASASSSSLASEKNMQSSPVDVEHEEARTSDLNTQEAAGEVDAAQSAVQTASGSAAEAAAKTTAEGTELEPKPAPALSKPEQGKDAQSSSPVKVQTQIKAQEPLSAAANSNADVQTDDAALSGFLPSGDILSVIAPTSKAKKKVGGSRVNKGGKSGKSSIKGGKRCSPASETAAMSEKSENSEISENSAEAPDAQLIGVLQVPSEPAADSASKENMGAAAEDRQQTENAENAERTDGSGNPDSSACTDEAQKTSVSKRNKEDVKSAAAPSPVEGQQGESKESSADSVRRSGSARISEDEDSVREDAALPQDDEAKRISSPRATAPKRSRRQELHDLIALMKQQMLRGSGSLVPDGVIEEPYGGRKARTTAFEARLNRIGAGRNEVTAELFQWQPMPRLSVDWKAGYFTLRGPAAKK